MTVKRIAMWSGPRNLSTALLRSFGSRGDCAVVDEPFYAAYLLESGVQHPMRNLILDKYDSDPIKVAENCVNSPKTRSIEYQKHMTHHMMNGFDKTFIFELTNAFLIRSPEKVIRSYGEKIKDFDIWELGFIQQAELFRLVVEKTNIVPPVIDADDLCENPQKGLSLLCSRLKIKFMETMLRWEKGPHNYDGVWGEYWYKSVNRSTGFERFETPLSKTSDFQNEMISLVEPYYQILQQHKLKF